MKKIRLHTALALLAAVLSLAWLPARAQAQNTFSFVINPATLSALPGANALTFSGTLTNTGTTALTFGQDNIFTLLTGPVDPADPNYLMTGPVYSDGSFYGPNSLAPGSTVGSIFSVNIDPAALLGTYTGNILFSYGGQTVGQDVTVNVGVPPVPEAGTLPLLALGVGYIGYVLLAARRRAAAQR